MRRHLLVASLLLPPGTVCLAQDPARMEQVVLSFTGNGSFTGSILVARGDEVLFDKRYGTVPARQAVASLTKTVHGGGRPAARGTRQASSR